ncbi:MAG: TIGR00282 family metallophosphoesterase [Candidatus Omnitrophica bacterium]|nr:TIGR00282 family metallophosphoesterase [Candidatus Omnitrophota bacterium]
MRVLFIGDVVGEPGRRAIKQLVPRLRQQHEVHLVVANGENAAGGAGITGDTAAEMFGAGVDVITTGDHIWDQKEIVQYLPDNPRLLRPLNYPPGAIGHGSILIPLPDAPAAGVVNLQGRVFMASLECPFACAQAEIKRLREKTRILLVDFHAEATSEKIALARFLDGQVSAVIGTHTHVQTADEQIFPGGTAFLCDAGFTGAQESVLGREIEPVIQRFVTQLPQRFKVAKGNVRLNGALIDIDDQTGRARSILRLSAPLPIEVERNQQQNRNGTLGNCFRASPRAKC